MRDEHGRYHSVKTITDNGPEWAAGCPSCTYGIASAPELTGAVELHMERLVQHIAGDITYCTCQAGTRYKVYLLNRRQKLIEEARKDARMADAAKRLSHPDIQIAQARIERSYVMAQPPTMHMAGEVPA